MSDLQCAVRVFLAPGELTAPSLARLTAERVVSVLAPPTEPYARSGSTAAEALACPVEHRPAVEDAGGLVATLQDLADTYRGEAVLLVVEPSLVHETVGRLGAAGGSRSGADGPVLLEGDADGWVVRHWPGEPAG